MFALLTFSLSICCIQLIGAWLRFLSFKQDMSPEQIRSYWRKVLCLSLLALPLYACIFHSRGVAVQPYKAVLMLGWIPYQLLFLWTVRGRYLEHLFVWSMSALWSFICHNWSNIVLAIFFYGQAEDMVLKLHAFLYLIWFLLLFPIARVCFTELLPAFSLFQSKLVRAYTAILPTVMLLGFVVLIADSTLWHSWEERLARLLLPVAFFISYHLLLKSSRRIYEQRRLEQKAAIMAREVAYLEEGKKLVEGSRAQAQAQQESLFSMYGELEEFIKAGEIEKARQLIAAQDMKLSAASITPYTDYPIINAAISIYLRKAEEKGLSVKQKVNLPKGMGTDEQELAVLLSNLLENALLAVMRDKETGAAAGPGSISLILQHIGEQCVLEIVNTSVAPLHLGKDGLPVTSRQGHGLGMLSLRNFLKRYDGYADFTQEQGQVTLSMYWEDKKC